ncbi:MAG: hypothetical protein ICV87_10365 [Gemmatimonadetes bacterium]|nr:hypothetical protein [Gemmatimonadota bacterium]
MSRRKTTGPAIERPPEHEGPSWGRRVLWGVYGLLVGFAVGIVASLLVLSWAGPFIAQLLFRVSAYGFILAGLDYGGERRRWKQALLRGFGLGAAIALLRVAFSTL